jgi:hypothetical protein
VNFFGGSFFDGGFFGSSVVPVIFDDAGARKKRAKRREEEFAAFVKAKEDARLAIQTAYETIVERKTRTYAGKANPNDDDDLFLMLYG